MTLITFEPDFLGLPARLQSRWPSHLPIYAMGKLELLFGLCTALFCSTRCPGDQILKAYNLAQNLRDRGVTVISGFHSPVEKECLRILLRGSQPIIICPARSLEKFRLPADWKQPLADGRLLLLSPFPAAIRRPTAATAHKRNELVAALADEIYVIHATPGGRLDKLLSYFTAEKTVHKL